MLEELTNVLIMLVVGQVGIRLLSYFLYTLSLGVAKCHIYKFRISMFG